LLNGRNLDAFNARTQPSTERDISAPSRGESFPLLTASIIAACAETASAMLSSLGLKRPALTRGKIEFGGRPYNRTDDATTT
jgi:hypothetical protein